VFLSVTADIARKNSMCALPKRDATPRGKHGACIPPNPEDRNKKIACVEAYRSMFLRCIQQECVQGALLLLWALD